MKKIILADEELDFNTIELPEAFIDILVNEAYHCRYDMEDAGDGTYTFKAKEYTENMPVVTTKRYVENRKGVQFLWFEPTMHFPSEIGPELAEYDDSFEWWMEKWSNAGALCTRLNKTPFRSDYEYV